MTFMSAWLSHRYNRASTESQRRCLRFLPARFVVEIIGLPNSPKLFFS